MTLADDLRDWMARLLELADEGQDLQQRVAELEKHNKFLHHQVSAEAVRSNGMEALSSLYDDGFHICHANFAQSRDGDDCLFCLSFLHKEGIGK